MIPFSCVVTLWCLLPKNLTTTLPLKFHVTFDMWYETRHEICDMSHTYHSRVMSQTKYDLNPSGAYWLYTPTLRWCNYSLIKRLMTFFTLSMMVYHMEQCKCESQNQVLKLREETYIESFKLIGFNPNPNPKPYL